MELQTVQPLNQYQPASSRAKKVGKEFESFFVYQTLELMQPEIDTKSSFYGGPGERMFRQVLNEHIAAEIAERGDMGIRESVENQIAKYRKAAK